MQQDILIKMVLSNYFFCLIVFHRKSGVTNSNVNDGELEVWVWRSNDTGNNQPNNCTRDRA